MRDVEFAGPLLCALAILPDQSHDVEPRRLERRDVGVGAERRADHDGAQRCLFFSSLGWMHSHLPLRGRRRTRPGVTAVASRPHR